MLLSHHQYGSNIHGSIGQRIVARSIQLSRTVRRDWFLCDCVIIQKSTERVHTLRTLLNYNIALGSEARGYGLGNTLSHHLHGSTTVMGSWVIILCPHSTELQN